MQATAHDPRVTRVGRLLRATALDELPQLWNIFRGDMSFVGPRALRPNEIEQAGDGRAVPLEAVPGFTARCTVTPGLTGLAQIYLRRDVTRTPEVSIRPAVRSSTFVHARCPPDSAVVLDFLARPLGSTPAEILMLDTISDPGIRDGHYAAKQIFCRDGLIAWSHRRRFEVGLRLAARFAGRRILDYGCGDGTFLALLQATPSRPVAAVGAELDDGQVEDCRKRFAGRPTLAFLRIADLDDRPARRRV